MKMTQNSGETTITQWIHRQFNKDKVRYSERYRRVVLNRNSICSFFNSTATSSPSPSPHSVLFIPDGAFLRKYLLLIEEILNSHTSLTKVQEIKLILLESAAEYMDYRNSSPCIVHNSQPTITQKYNKDDNGIGIERSYCYYTKQESSAINERNRILKLCMDHNRQVAYNGAEVIPFPDLTLKQDNQFGNDFDDDFNVFDYINMNVKDRSICAIKRAAKFFFQTALSELETSTSSTTNNSTLKNHIDIIILSDEDNIDTENFIPCNDKSFTDSVTVKYMSSDDLVSFVSNLYGLDNDTEEQLVAIEDHWTKLHRRCKEEYNSRNTSNDTQTNTAYQKDKFGQFEYLHDDELQRGIKEKKFFKGKLKVTSQNCREAYCSVKGEGGNIVKYFLNGNKGHFNRAIHDDVVIIEPLPKSQWNQPLGKNWLSQIDNDEDVDSIDVQNFQNGDSEIMPTAQVVGLYNSGNQLRRQFIATMVPKAIGAQFGDNAIVVVPMDSKIPKIRIKTRIEHQRIANKRLLVEIDSWNLDSMYPNGHYIKTVGDVGDLDSEINCLMIERNINNAPFSANALVCLPKVNSDQSWVVSEEEVKKRRDLRSSCRIFSVDPPGCQDIDDAMHAKVLETGDIEIGVHIADVTHFVKLRGALDLEASKRGTTFYLVDRRFDMLPSLLSSNLCSLHGNADRYAVSVIWTLSPDLDQVKSTWYGRSVIHNVQAMTYDQAHNILHDIEPDNLDDIPPPLTAGAPVDRSIVKDLKHDLTILTALARKLRHRREMDGGAVDLTGGDRGSELKFVLDSDGKPIKVTPKKELEIHHTIAELMIMSNAFVAETIYRHYPDSSILRIHQKANVDGFEDFKKLSTVNGMKINGSSSNKSLAKSLKEAESSTNSLQYSLFQSLAIRAMSEAQYVCTGALEEGVQLSHFGLGINMYCHFTSPIRRYADIAVHHLLLASLSKKEATMDRLPVQTNTNNSILLPKSDAISILAGDGIAKREDKSATSEDDLDEDFLDSLIEGTSNLAVINTNVETTDNVINNNNEPYSTTELSRICSNLNIQNRSAKASSMDCQRLFLSLFFKNRTELTQAIIVDLCQNGLIVYVPRFDMKGPLYLLDRNGCLHINPNIMKLPAYSGLPPSLGFKGYSGCRMFPDGKYVMHNPSDITKAKVEVSLPGSTEKLIFKYLDVITVQVSCDLSNTTARIPPPRFDLISKSHSTKASPNMKRESKSFDTISEEEKQDETDGNEAQSIFKILSAIEVKPIIEGPMRWESNMKRIEVKGRVQTMQGRIHFGAFKSNESNILDYRYTTPNMTSLEEYAKQGNYDASRRIEREATSRIQRKAAEKRNARRAKRN